VETVWLEKDLLDKISREQPDAAMLLAGLTRDSDVLMLGIAQRLPIIPGKFEGLLSLREPGGKPQVYRVRTEASPEAGGMKIRIEVSGHSEISVISAHLWNGGSWSRVEVTDREGRLSRFER
jgi:hypothetical protein